MNIGFLTLPGRCLVSALMLSVVCSAVSRAAEPYRIEPVAEGGTLSGRVLMGSATPEQEHYAVTKDADVCHGQERVVDWVSGADGGLSNAVVFITNIITGKPFAASIDAVTINQQGCVFTPWVQVLKDGGTLRVRNADPIMHNMHAYEIIYSARRTVFNQTQPGGDMAEQTAEMHVTRGNSIEVDCDVHEFMHAWLFVARNPYFALVDGRGEFRISDIPPGHYSVRSWHGRLGFRESEVEIRAGASTRVDFSY